MTRAAAFARAVRARHARAVPQPAPVTRVLRRPAALLATTVVRRATFVVAPRIRLAFALPRPAARDVAASPLPATLGASGRRLVEGVLARAVRDDGAGTGGAPARVPRVALPVPGPAPHAAPPAATVPRIAPVPRVAVRQPRPSETAPPAAPRDAPRAAPAAPAAPLPPAELERVTSHVVRTLDRRLAAWRERSGRI